MARIAVVGAGVFGTWTAVELQRRGHQVTLLDAFGPGHSRSSSGDESRIIRAAYGKDEIYSRMALESLPDWEALSAAGDLPIFLPAGVLFFFPGEQPYLADSIAVHRRLGLPSELLDQAELRRRFPMFDFADVAIGLYEPRFGALVARRGVQLLADRFVRAGGVYRPGAAAPIVIAARRLDALALADGTSLAADLFVIAAGPWLPKLLPDVVGRRIRVTRQEVFYFAPPAGDRAFQVGQMPVWADFNAGDMYYGFPDIEGRGVKFAHDVHGAEADPDTLDRRASETELAIVGDYRDRRFPALRGAPLTEARVCQYENSSSGDLLIDFHPAIANVLIVGGGSGHGFKHGPAVGRYAADRLLGTGRAEPRFSLAGKSLDHARAVH